MDGREWSRCVSDYYTCVQREQGVKKCWDLFMKCRRSVFALHQASLVQEKHQVGRAQGYTCNVEQADE